MPHTVLLVSTRRQISFLLLLPPHRRKTRNRNPLTSPRRRCTLLWLCKHYRNICSRRRTRRHLDERRRAPDWLSVRAVERSVCGRTTASRWWDVSTSVVDDERERCPPHEKPRAWPSASRAPRPRHWLPDLGQVSHIPGLSTTGEHLDLNYILLDSCLHSINDGTNL